MPRALFEAAVVLLVTLFTGLCEFTLGLWAEARPAASTETRIVVVIVIAGFVFILSLLLLHR